jgi:hypothetical protein
LPIARAARNVGAKGVRPVDLSAGG